MIDYVIAGLVMGGIYALLASGLVVTYVSTGVMNFSFGALAFMVARLYYYLHVTHHWGIVPSAIVSIPIAGGMIGALLYFLLFRFLSRADPLVQIASTIGLAVAIPPTLNVVLGTPVIETTPGLAPLPVSVYHIGNAVVTLDQVLTYVCVAVVLSVGVLILKFTSAGITLRAMVDSPALGSLQGIDSRKVGASVWAICVALAGLVGVLAGPIVGLNSPNNYTLLLAAAFAAVVGARLRRLGVAVAIGFGMGVVGALLQWKLPPDSSWTTAALPSVPFLFIVVFLIWVRLRGEQVGQTYTNLGGVLDEAIHVNHESVSGSANAGVSVAAPNRSPVRRIGRGIGVLTVQNLVLFAALLLPVILSGYRVSLVSEGVAFAVAFLSYTLLAGEGGMIWLCQVTFAGFGAIGAAHLVTIDGWPLLVAMLVVALGTGVIGAILGALTVRMGELYVALVTLTFGLLVSNIVFIQNVFVHDGAGVALLPPSWAKTSAALDYFTIAVFVVCGLIVWCIRRSTLGMVLAAQRSSPRGAQAVGARVNGARIVTSGIAAAIAATGGVLLTLCAGAAVPSTFQALVGLVWIAVIVTLGVRAVNAALLAGLVFVFLPNLFTTYLSGNWNNVPAIAFGLGAIMVAKDPRGVFSSQAAEIRRLGRWLYERLRPQPDPVPSEPIGKVLV
jgi:branched-chain amino acid transport system permease protein